MDACPGGASYEYSGAVVETADGGLVSLGYTTSFGAGGWDLWLIKVDSDGNELWNRTFGGPGGRNREEGHQVIEASDGGLVLIGHTDQYGAGSRDAWLIKTDSQGNELWNRTFGGEAPDAGYSVQETPDGGLIVGGYTSSFGAGQLDSWLIKTDSDGNELWNKTFGGAGNDYCFSVQQTMDGGFACAGYTSPTPDQRDVWLFKADSEGNELWSQTFGGSGFDVCYELVETADAGLVLFGDTESRGAGGPDCWLIKTDSQGNELWNRTYGGEAYDSGSSVQETRDGGLVLLGQTNSYGAGGNDLWLIRTDSEGNELWNQTYGGNGSDVGRSVQETRDGGFALLGFTNSYGAGGYDLWLVRLGGDTPPPCDLEVALSNYPESVARNGTLAFRVDATNGCDDPLTFDRAVMNITGPASLEKVLYDGDPFTVVGIVGTDLSLGVPSGAPLGTYTVEVTIYRAGEAIDAAAFEVAVSG